MTSNSTPSSLVCKAVLAVLLLSVAVSGIPMVEVHSHENVTFGHSHDAHELTSDHAVDEIDSDDADTNMTSFHAHNVNLTSVSLISISNVEFAVPQYSHSHIPPPRSWLPDNIIAPLYRPPIA